MSDAKIEPALSAEEWARTAFHREADPQSGAIIFPLAFGLDARTGVQPAYAARTIALANAALPDDDPRKLTWRWADAIREAADTIAAMEDDRRTTQGTSKPDPELLRIADALASYLPPRTS